MFNVNLSRKQAFIQCLLLTLGTPALSKEPVNDKPGSTHSNVVLQDCKTNSRELKSPTSAPRRIEHTLMLYKSNSDFHSPADHRIRRAYLRVDNKGLPVIGPIPTANRATGRVNSIWNLSVDELEDLWGPATLEGDVHQFQFIGYYGRWCHFKVDLRFSESRCSAIRIMGPNVTWTDWISKKDILEPSLSRSMITPPELFGIIEGPRDQSDCGGHDFWHLSKCQVDKTALLSTTLVTAIIDIRSIVEAELDGSTTSNLL
ncbi:MAG: hypothetical protein SGJ27_14270 [Candidatus Melainabacteria bacterium]|nr:hypothetical protein [Candidatus Melainabacteria bacterium]